MKTSPRSIEKHLFICTNVKESGECCGTKGSKALIKELKQKLRDNYQYETIRVSGSSCLGPCADGISAVVYPENDQLTQIKKNDVNELYNILTRDN